VLPYAPNHWKQAGRLQGAGQTLGKNQIWQVWLVQLFTAIAVFYVMQELIYAVMLYWSIALTKVPFMSPSRTLFRPPTTEIIWLLIFVFASSRWMLDGLLKFGHGLQPLSLQQLATHSPETAQSLPRFCQQKRLPMPALGVLPISVPIAFSYGCIPHASRIVVSQGLLDQLADDEIATVYANEVAHLACWTVPLMSGMTALMQIPYTLYCVAATWGDRQQAAVFRGVATLVAALSYGIYSLVRWIALWCSRQRVYVSDRTAVELTGNPNGWTRALLKIAIGTANEVQSHGKTRYLLEGFDLLSPLGHRMATTLGSVHAHAPVESVLTWEWQHPLRHWLALNNSHPPTGDRLHRLAGYARQWKLTSELNLGQRSPSQQRSIPWRSLLLQGAPFFGALLGLLLAMALLSLGSLGYRLNWRQLFWLYADASLQWGFAYIGFSLGTLVRINHFFPDSPIFGTRPTNASPGLTELLQDSTVIPLDSQPVRLEGKLLGRAEIGNLLSQDLLLKTETGIVRLHWLTKAGPIGNLVLQPVRPTALLHQKVTVTGWFRRGATAWIDVDTLRSASGRVSRSHHPIWSTALVAIAALLGIAILIWGRRF
jgi:Zn-dependent protease with chaperone function